MRVDGVFYRAHDPRWAFAPLSGAGAARRGGRFNQTGVPALYLAATILGAVAEANQGFAFKIQPCVLCAYDVACDDVADLRSDAGRAALAVPADQLACAWAADLAARREPASWNVARRLIAAGASGMLVRSFAPGSTEADHNLVLWRWGDGPAHRVMVHDPAGRLPRDQASWPSAVADAVTPKNTSPSG